MNMAKINWIAVVAAVATLGLVLVSLFVPWWQLTIGNGDPILAQANFSPVNLNVAIFGTNLTVPLIWALNLASMLSLLSGAIIMLLYAAVPNKSYSKNLLGFGWNKPVYAIILFVIELITLMLIAQNLVGFNIPLTGPSMINLPQSMTQGVDVSVAVTANFQWPFYLAIAVAALCVAARIYHRKVTSPTPAIPQ
jgi:hypothetical protein